jgi:hypothetical protein
MQPLEKPIAKANTMITQRQIKELLEEARVEAKRTLDHVTEVEGAVSCSLSYDAGYYEGQKDLLEMLLKMKKVKYIIN